MRINDGDHLSAFRLDIVEHVLGGREMVAIPREIFLRICVLDIQPQHIIRNVMLIEGYDIL